MSNCLASLLLETSYPSAAKTESRWCEFGDLFTFVMATEPMDARVAQSYYRQLVAALTACAAAKDADRAPNGDGVLHLDVKVSYGE